MSHPIRRIGSVIAVSIALFWLAGSTWAQQSGLGQTQGSGTAGFSSMGGQSSVPLTGFSLSSRFNSNFGKFTGGSQSIGQTTAGAAAGTSGVFGQSGGNSGFGAGGFGAGGFGSNAMSSFGRTMGFGMGSAYGNRRGMNQQGNSTKKKGVLRTHMRLGFQPSGLSSEALGKRSTDVINRVLVRESYASSPITVQLTGRVAVLRGTVQSEHGRDIAARLALLEPGISDVQNELIVSPPEPKPETAPKSSVLDPFR